MVKKISWFLMAIFFLVVSASPCMSFGYKPNEDEKNRILQVKKDICQAAKKEGAQKRIIRGGEPPAKNKPVETSISINGYNVESRDPITVLPPGSGTITLNPGENKTFVRPNSGGLQVVGQDVSVTPNR